jgi:hypothetical protein
MTQKNQHGYKKNAEFYADFEFADAGFKKVKKVIGKKVCEL